MTGSTFTFADLKPGGNRLTSADIIMLNFPVFSRIPTSPASQLSNIPVDGCKLLRLTARERLGFLKRVFYNFVHWNQGLGDKANPW